MGGKPQFNRGYQQFYSETAIKDMVSQTGAFLTDQIAHQVQEQQEGK